MNIKPGWQTTEFWIAIVTFLFGALTLTGVIGEEESNQWAELFKTLIMVIVPSVYINGRAKVKSAAK
jgi:hypothetical protein